MHPPSATSLFSPLALRFRDPFDVIFPCFFSSYPPDPLRPPSHSLPPERMHHPGGGGGGDGLGEAPGEDTTTDPLQQHHHRSRRRTERRSPFWHRPSNALSRPRWRTLAIAVALSLLVFAVGDSLQDAAVASPSSSTRYVGFNKFVVSIIA